MHIVRVVINGACGSGLEVDTDTVEVVCLTPRLMALRLLVTWADVAELLLGLNERLRSFDK